MFYRIYHPIVKVQIGDHGILKWETQSLRRRRRHQQRRVQRQRKPKRSLIQEEKNLLITKKKDPTEKKRGQEQDPKRGQRLERQGKVDIPNGMNPIQPSE
eukprot:XP_019924311.1 PREDICTED: uncharacterized protein LOC109619202 isoform X2 [Crassostrea gigas]